MTLSSALRETEWEDAVVTVTGGGEELASWKLTDVAAYADGDYAEGSVAEDFDKPELTVSRPVLVPVEDKTRLHRPHDPIDGVKAGVGVIVPIVDGVRWGMRDQDVQGPLAGHQGAQTARGQDPGS